MAVESATQWAWQYNLATSKMLTSFKTADQTGAREDKAAAKNSFATTMASMLPTTVTTSPQYQYYSALDTLNNTLESTNDVKKRQAAMTTFYSSLEKITF